MHAADSYSCGRCPNCRLSDTVLPPAWLLLKRKKGGFRGADPGTVECTHCDFTRPAETDGELKFTAAVTAEMNAAERATADELLGEFEMASGKRMTLSKMAVGLGGMTHVAKSAVSGPLFMDAERAGQIQRRAQGEDVQSLVVQHLVKPGSWKAASVSVSLGG